MARNKFTSETARKAGQKSKRKPSPISGRTFRKHLPDRDRDTLIEHYSATPLAELKELVQDESLPSYELIIIRGILKDFETGTMTNTETMLSRKEGKPVQKTVNENHNFDEKKKALDKVPREKIIELVKAAEVD